MTSNVDAGIELAQAQRGAHQGSGSAKSTSTTPWRRRFSAPALSTHGAMPTRCREFKLAVPILMAALARDRRRGRHHRRGARQGAQIVVESYMRCWRAAARRRSIRGRKLPSGRSGAQPVGAAGARRFERALHRRQSGARRTGAQDAGHGEADRRPARPAQQHPGPAAGRARRKALKTLQADIEKMRGARDGAKKEIGRQVPQLRQPGRPAPPTRTTSAR